MSKRQAVHDAEFAPEWRDMRNRIGDGTSFRREMCMTHIVLFSDRPAVWLVGFKD
jgi:hypothetical protein